MQEDPKDVENADIVSTNFQPSEFQIKFLQAAINIGTYKNKTSVSQEADVDRGCWYAWLKQAGFAEWFYEEFNKSIKFRIFELDMICFNKASSDFKYMELLQKKYGGIAPVSPGVNVNVTANAKAEANTEIDLGTEETKKRLASNLGILQRYGCIPQFASEE